MSDPSLSADTSNRRAISPKHSQDALAENGPRVSAQSDQRHAAPTGQSTSILTSQIASASPVSSLTDAKPHPKSTSSSSLSKQLWANSIDDPQIDERDSIYTTTYFPANSPPSSSFRPRTTLTSSKSIHGEPASTPKFSLAGATRRKVTFDSRSATTSSPSTTPKASSSSQSILTDSIRSSIDTPATTLDFPSISKPPSTISRSYTVQMGNLQDHGNENNHATPHSPLGSPIRFSSSPPQYYDRGAHELSGEDDERIRYRSWREGNPELRVSSASARSKSGESRVDRKIEAILPKVDAQAKSTRSRKSSQYMGLFKENDATTEQSRRDTLGGNAIKDEIKGGKDKATAESKSILDDEIYAEPQDVSRLESISESSSTEQSKGVYDALGHGGPNQRETSPSLKGIPDLHRKVLLAKTGAAESIRRSSLAESAARHSEGTAVISKDRQASASSTISITDSDKTECARTSSVVSIAATEEDEESEKETISSATYIPHRQVRTGTSIIELPRRPTVLRTQSATIPKRPVEDPEDGVDHGAESPHEVEISLKSQGTEQLWHGAMNEPTESADSPPEYESSQDYEGASSASGFESMDESVASTNGYNSDEEALVSSPNTPKALLPRRKPHRPREPMSAVPLKPFRHQVGGHNTVFQFSRKTICKKMNNRENVFYEVVEKYHPELLDFMPRYIGVLNVTFSKAPKRKRGDSIAQVEPLVQPEQNAGTKETTSTGFAAPHSRIVSHSQQSMSIPQVIFEHNRHIIPDNLFRVPTSPISPAPLSPHQRDPRRLSHSRPLNPIESISRDSSPRPNIRTWGSTRVNRRLQEQVLREVFAPPLIHRHRLHSRHHGSVSDVPLLPASVDRVSSVATYQRSRSDVQQLYPDSAFIVEETGESSNIGAALTLSRTAPDDDADYLDQRPISSSNSATSASATRSVRRRHSGSGLRRRPIDAVSGIRSELEFHEEDGYGADQEDEVFAMDKDDQLRPSASTVSISGGRASVPTTQNNEAPVPSEQIPHGDTRAPLVREPSESMPSQTDARVEMFILLEDLTARMDKPCVLDLKMGTRQYGVEADESKQRSQRRKCKSTTSRELGVRVCGMQVWNVKTQSYLFEDKYFGRDLKAGTEFQAALARFFFDGLGYTSARRYIPVILDQISKLERIVRHLPGYRLYASSLLIIYDRAAEAHSPDGSSPPSPPDLILSGLPHKLERASSGPPIHPVPELSSPTRVRKLQPCPIQIKIVDFANCVTKEDTSRLEQATIPPQDPDGVDRGYLRGLRTLRLYFQRIWKEYADVDYEERGEGEGELESRKGAWNETAVTWDDPGEVSV